MNAPSSETMISWTDLPSKADLLLFLKGENILVVDITDESSADRLEWLEACSFEFDVRSLHKSKYLEPPYPIQSADILIVSGSKPAAVARVIRQYEREFEGRPKIAVVKDSSPAERTEILNSGFDSVFDPQKERPETLLAGLVSIIRRYGFTRRAAVDSMNINTALHMISYKDRLNRREALILDALLTAPDRIVKSEDLQSILSISHDPISNNQLKVLITYARRKLRPGVQIVNLTRLGRGPGAYKLLTSDIPLPPFD